MGCFSFKCKESGKPALSTSFDGSPVYMFLLKDGEIIEEMYGNYDSYGRVFKTTFRTDVKHKLKESFEWSMDWGVICDLIFNDNEGDGIAVVLEEYYDPNNKPTTQSEDDPDQGWGDPEEDEYLLFDVSTDKFKEVKQPYHKVNVETSTSLQLTTEEEYFTFIKTERQ